MRSLLLSIVFLLCSTLFYAQIKMGIKGGIAVSNYRSSTDYGYTPDYSVRLGFMADIFFDVPIAGVFSVQPEVQCYTAGAKARVTEEYTVPSTSGYTMVKLQTKAKFRPLYLAVPVYFKANIVTGSDKISLGIGPMVEYGLGGKAMVQISNLNVNKKAEGDIKLFEKDEYHLTSEGSKIETESPDEALLKRLSLGLSGLIQYEWKQKYTLALSYHYGLRNISNTSDEELRIRNLSFVLGYKF